MNADINIRVTDHAIARYKERIDDSLSDEEIKKELLGIYKSGKKTKLRECVFEKNATEYIFENKNAAILVIIKYAIKGKKRKYYGGVIVTCLGDSTTRKWYKEQANKTYARAGYIL
ncbi:hypothetical protein [Clostridium tyrobutyricum]|jgi:hypothetical protein|uniref:hypothetical protein n=2 Tax=Clostridium TaxID=1485 RepID=UPI000E7EF39D|nr:hypothetical protein [Clostridium tyrobutyricum]HBF76636.1 hypothetical protein [Clostridiaceae bacterium]